MLLLIDLDNTLLDRRAAFKAWSDSRYGPRHTPWLVEVDRNGYAPRAEVAVKIAERFGDDHENVLAELRKGMVDNMTLDPEVAAALAEARAAGLVPYVVSNGTVAQQEAKLRRTGLDRLVAGWTISEGAGAAKPDRRIFAQAAAAAGHPLTGWMVGDNPGCDIVGGAAAGLRTGWISDGEPWPADAAVTPTVIAPDCPGVLRAVMQHIDDRLEEWVSAH